MIHISKAALERKCAFASQTFTHVKMPQFFPDFPKEATAERDIPPPPPAFLQQPFQITELDRLLEGHTDRAGQQVPRQVRHQHSAPGTEATAMKDVGCSHHVSPGFVMGQQGILCLGDPLWVRAHSS